jgi:hypothetical protein
MWNLRVVVAREDYDRDVVSRRIRGEVVEEGDRSEAENMVSTAERTGLGTHGTLGSNSCPWKTCVVSCCHFWLVGACKAVIVSGSAAGDETSFRREESAQTVEESCWISRRFWVQCIRDVVNVHIIVRCPGICGHISIGQRIQVVHVLQGNV